MSIAKAVCDRCHFKVDYDTLKADGNAAGLRVCPECWDSIDRWRLAPRKTEDISLRFARPDTSVAT